MTKSNEHEPPHIVSSEHLASAESWHLSELEYGLIVAFNAFSRWTTRCMVAVGYDDFNPLDVLVLHHVNHRNRAKRLADIAFVLNVEDLHTVNYSMKKLIKYDLIESEKRGKEMFYSTTSEGRKICAAYRDVRELCLVESEMSKDKEEVTDTARYLRNVSGLYDQASRAAASL